MDSGVERFKRSTSFRYVGKEGRTMDGMWTTTYKDHLDKFLKSKTGANNLEIYDIHRGKAPPRKTPKVRWDKHRSAWVRADNLQYNFVKDTWKPHFRYDHPGITGSEARFQSSKAIGKELKNENGALATTLGHWGQRIVSHEMASEILEDDSKTRVTSARSDGAALCKPKKTRVPKELYASLPDADLLERNVGGEGNMQQPHEWAGIKTEKLFLSANPNLYGRWYRTASNVRFNAEPHDRFVTSKMVENEQANKLYLHNQKWKKGYNFAKFHKNKKTSVSTECPAWMQVPGVRLNNPDDMHTTKMTKYVESGYSRHAPGMQAASVASGSVIRAHHDKETPHFDHRFRYSSRKLKADSRQGSPTRMARSGR